MTKTRPLLLFLGPLAVVAAACGGGGDSETAAVGDGDADRTVEIEMVDIAFEPAELEVEAGETVRFVFENTGKAAHDAFVGDIAAQGDHEREMREAEEDDGHGGGHDENDAEDAITVEPGETGELTYTFDESGSLEIGCHQPGHYEAGMKIDVTVR
jgi:uncharacterized cupredoxin-like copper-binding protein